MSEEKQIEEMFNLIVDGVIDGEDNHGVPTGKTCFDIAESLYNAGYRKQSEGEWEIVKGSNGKEKMVCTNCRHQQDLASTFTYCPNCGAKMKGV